ncbi:hypothetical protein ACV8T5_16360 [Citrobacter freundii]|uniref:hypothetical protein n=1 Tax=Citrobacter freundii TaxID=546 RepID=UPI000A83AA4D|nr:hypothetical protein [Citrobacter freundii]WIJ94535.1 hypothetical protein OI904_24475 [Citrobacter freundii]
MHRIDTPTAQKDKFGAGKNGFTRGNPQTGTPATDLDDDYFDMLQEELARVVEASGVNLEKSKHNQLLTALKALLLSRAHPFADIKADGAAAIAEALSNLGLGDVLHLGDYGVGKAIQSSAAQRTHVGSFFYEPGVPGSTLYPVSVAVTESGGPTPGEWVQLAISYGADFRVFVGHQTYGGTPEISELFHDKRKPSNSDVGSYPATGGTLHGSLAAEGSVQGGPGYDVVSQQDIWAGRNIYESGKRVFSPNNHQPVIADGQTWVDVTASRQLGATYTNTTGRPIQMLLDFVRPANDWHIGVKIGNVAFSNGGGSYCPIIPAGSTYAVLSEGISQYTWRELR